MTIARSAAEVMRGHVALELECMDRLYVNAYVPILQSGAGVSHYFRELRGYPVPSSALMAPMTRSFVASIERFAREKELDLVRLSRGERKDERTRERLRDRDCGEGVLYIGKAQERARVVRTERRHDPATGVGQCALDRAHELFAAIESGSLLILRPPGSAITSSCRVSAGHFCSLFRRFSALPSGLCGWRSCRDARVQFGE